MGGGTGNGTLMGGEKLMNPYEAFQQPPKPDGYDYGVRESQPRQESFTIPRDKDSEKQVREFLEALKRLKILDERSIQFL